MDILSSAIKGISTFITSAKTPKSFVDGEKFEKYIRNVIFTSDIYKIISKTHSYAENSKDYIESSLNPDYEFQPFDSKWSFHVECKYRDITSNIDKILDVLDEHNIKDDTVLSKDEDLKIDKLIRPFSYVNICDEDQLDRYKQVNETKDVVIALGLKNEYSSNTEVFIIPISDLNVKYIHMDILDHYIVPNDHHIIPPNIYNMIHGEESYCIRCKTILKKGILSSLCYNCWKDWHKYKNFLYTEKYCVECGHESKTSVAKPMCLDCYKNSPY